MALTVWSVCVGDKYGPEQVLIMRDMVARNITVPHYFKCLADRQIPGVDTVIPTEVWPGWWSKLLLFNHSFGFNLYLDLDVVIAGPLDGLISTRLSMPANWAKSGHGGCQSSVMAWGKDYSQLPKHFHPERLTAPERGNCGWYGDCWGDQEYITERLGDPGRHVKPMGSVYSYKYHCQNGPPAAASVICFHGEPKPQNVGDQWVKQLYTRTPPSLTKCG